MTKDHASIDTLNRIVGSGAAIMVLTMVHHVYGAVIYNTPFRMHVVWFAVPVLAVMILTYVSYLSSEGSNSGRVAILICLFVTLIIAIGTFGFVEGGYNHLAKNLFFFSGMEPSVLDRIYPDEYELPNDFWFESTGVIKFFVGLYGFIQFVKLRRLEPDFLRI